MSRCRSSLLFTWAAVLALAGCAAGGGGTRVGGPGEGVVHVHGLGVDPADGALYAATHTGLFRVLKDGTATRVAGRYQDTMAFAVAGPRTFLGSGHPAVGDDQPARLGLIESTDAGESWRPLSLGGEADFHALQVAHGRVYGFDAASGRFMVSANRTRWDERSTLRLHHFAVSPDDPEVVLATTEQGLLRSQDGGREFHRLPAQVAVALLAWPEGGDLYGIAPDGVVSHSADGGRTWTRRGQAEGTPEAVTVDARSGSVYVALADRGIVGSDDGGRTFTVRYAE